MKDLINNEDYTLDRLYDMFNSLVYSFKRGEELTNENLDRYLYLKGRIEQLTGRAALGNFSYFPNWALEFMNHPEYSKYRFKIIEKYKPRYDMPTELLDSVSQFEFIKADKYRIPLYVETELGLNPKFQPSAKYCTLHAWFIVSQQISWHLNRKWAATSCPVDEGRFL